MQAKSLNHLNDSQHDAVMHNEGPALIIAGPGSGKTRVITSRIAWLVENNTSIHQIAALTFTNKAAAEMKPAHAPLLRLRRLGLLHSPAQGQKTSAAIPRGDPTIHHSQAKRCNSCPPRPAWRVQIPNILDSPGFHETPFD